VDLVEFVMMMKDAVRRGAGSYTFFDSVCLRPGLQLCGMLWSPEPRRCYIVKSFDAADLPPARSNSQFAPCFYSVPWHVLSR
jgi:hypothetical protein